jgi:hypothetical protein
MSGNRPKYLSTKLIDKIEKKRKQNIVNDACMLLRANKSFNYIAEHIQNKYRIRVKDVIRYIQNLINEKVTHCILCNNERYIERGVFTLYCKQHYHQAKSDEREILKYMHKQLSLDITNHKIAPDILETHGDLYNIAFGFENRLGTSDIGSHPVSDIDREMKIIKREKKLLGLNNEKY